MLRRVSYGSGGRLRIAQQKIPQAERNLCKAAAKAKAWDTGKISNLKKFLMDIVNSQFNAVVPAHDAEVIHPLEIFVECPDRLRERTRGVEPRNACVWNTEIERVGRRILEPEDTQGVVGSQSPFRHQECPTPVVAEARFIHHRGRKGVRLGDGPEIIVQGKYCPLQGHCRGIEAGPVIVRKAAPNLILGSQRMIDPDVDLIHVVIAFFENRVVKQGPTRGRRKGWARKIGRGDKLKPFLSDGVQATGWDNISGERLAGRWVNGIRATYRCWVGLAERRGHGENSRPRRIVGQIAC